MNSAENKRIVENNLRLFMIHDAMVDDYISGEITRLEVMKKNPKRNKHLPQSKNKDKSPLKPKTFSLLEAIIICRGLDIKPIPNPESKTS